MNRYAWLAMWTLLLVHSLYSEQRKRAREKPYVSDFAAFMCWFITFCLMTFVVGLRPA